MKAAIFKGDGKFSIENVAKPELTAPDDVIIKVLVCSICGSDLNSSLANKRIGSIYGHEIVGEVAEIGPAVTNVAPGDRVVVNPNSYCDVCPTCRAGFRNHCENMELMGISVPGGFAEYVKSHARLVFKISRDVPLRIAAFAEPLSCAMNGFKRLQVRVGSAYVQIGCGPIGLLFANQARRSGARVVGIEPNASRRAIAEKLGFKIFSPFEENLSEKITAHFGRRPEFLVDTAGNQLSAAIELAGFCARILCFANSKEAVTGKIQGRELTVMGSFIIHDSMPDAIAALESGEMRLDEVVTHVMPLEELEKGMALMKSGEGMEIILTIGVDRA